LEIDGDLFYPKAHEEFLIKPGQKHRFWAEKSNFQIYFSSPGSTATTDRGRKRLRCQRSSCLKVVFPTRSNLAKLIG
jgi:hypothetical protein